MGKIQSNLTSRLGTNKTRADFETHAYTAKQYRKRVVHFSRSDTHATHASQKRSSFVPRPNARRHFSLLSFNFWFGQRGVAAGRWRHM